MRRSGCIAVHNLQHATGPPPAGRPARSPTPDAARLAPRMPPRFLTHWHWVTIGCAAVLARLQYGWSATMERIARSQVGAPACMPACPPARLRVCTSGAVVLEVHACLPPCLTRVGTRMRRWVRHVLPSHRLFSPHSVAAFQTLGDNERAKWMRGQRSLEINPRHPLIKEMKAQVRGCRGCRPPSHFRPARVRQLRRERQDQGSCRAQAAPPLHSPPLLPLRDSPTSCPLLRSLAPFSSFCPPACVLQHEANPESPELKEHAALLFQTCMLESGVCWLGRCAGRVAQGLGIVQAGTHGTADVCRLGLPGSGIGRDTLGFDALSVLVVCRLCAGRPEGLQHPRVPPAGQGHEGGGLERPPGGTWCRG